MPNRGGRMTDRVKKMMRFYKICIRLCIRYGGGDEDEGEDVQDVIQQLAGGAGNQQQQQQQPKPQVIDNIK